MISTPISSLQKKVLIESKYVHDGEWGIELFQTKEQKTRNQITNLEIQLTNYNKGIQTNPGQGVKQKQCTNNKMCIKIIQVLRQGS